MKRHRQKRGEGEKLAKLCGCPLRMTPKKALRDQLFLMVGVGRKISR